MCGKGWCLGSKANQRIPWNALLAGWGIPVEEQSWSEYASSHAQQAGCTGPTVLLSYVRRLQHCQSIVSNTWNKAFGATPWIVSELFPVS